MNFRQPGRMAMAMGGPSDFEQVLGNSGVVPQAMQAYGSPMRLAEGGSWGPFQHAGLPELGQRPLVSSAMHGA